ncbi:MAG: deoxyribose-phosphate aldolase [Flavobacterium sp. BFFFF2]|nr:MAG: deoxyribose-phosphate aldolase [Flavobacterium sp. BFFFF2]
MNALASYLDSTYLKTAQQQGITEVENITRVHAIVNEAIAYHFKLVMIRPEYVLLAKEWIREANSQVLVGTVIDFPTGTASTKQKQDEAQQAVEDQADELDFVADYEAFKRGENQAVKEQIGQLTRWALDQGKTVKWIIEIAALTPNEVVRFSTLIKNVVMDMAKEIEFQDVFVKSSTGFYVTENGKPNGATHEAITAMIENAFPLPVKAAGGVRNQAEAIAMIQLGVKRIGTSAAKDIVEGNQVNAAY